MSPSWLIEADVFGRSSEPIVAEVRRQGMAHEIVHPRPFLNGVIPVVAGRRLADGDCVVFWGTYPLMRHIQLNYRWIPGGWCSADQFDCGHYYPAFGQHMLNDRHSIWTLEDALANAETIFHEFSHHGQVFFRPCGLEKTFTGRCAGRDDFQSALESARYSRCRALVARPRRIAREWRLVASDRKIVAASQYRSNGRLDVSPGCPQEVWSHAESVLLAVPWRPDPIFMMDVCESDRNLRVLELNSFSCSGMYLCDAAAVVQQVKNLAGDEWHRRRASENKA